jgi:hypothetical protein
MARGLSGETIEKATFKIIQILSPERASERKGMSTV